ncbi:MAG: tetratricopeptide repeat protein [Candidatus Obscuribacterales bacterium]|nr:tetratricopeptide repeat protein [Candidatus Obscuribacterales bacterium]
MRRFSHQLLCSQLFSLVVLSSTTSSALAATPANNASFTQGVASFNAKDYVAANKSLSAYLLTSPNDYKAHFYRANSLVKLGRLDEASDEFKKVLTLTPDANTGNFSMGAFNRISELRSQSQNQKLVPAPLSASLPAPPSAQMAPAQMQLQSPQISLNSQFGNGALQPMPYQNMRPNFYNNAGNSSDLIPASVAGSGAKLSPTVNGQDPNSFSNGGPLGGHHGLNFQNQGYNPYMNGAPSGPMPSMPYAGQFGNPYPMGHHHGHGFQQGFMGGGANNMYARNAARNHMGGYIKNYEITDTPSGDALPLVADQKKFEDLAPQKITATKPKATLTAAKVATTKKVLNRN